MRRQRGDPTQHVVTVLAPASAPRTAADVAVLADLLAADDADRP